MSISVSSLTKCYGTQKAVNNISFSLNQGEICGFLGPNGAGKSTTMKIITGYIEEFNGNVSVCNTDIRQNPIKAKSLIGYLPEHNPLYPDMYIREYLQHVARLYNISSPNKRVDEIISLIGLTPEAHKKIGQLSKGYKQRVGLAQALVHDPEVLILDEPMTGLDPNQLEEIRALIIRIAQNKTVMLSTHVMQEVEAICSRIIIINKGEIVADQLKENIQQNKKEALAFEITFAMENADSWLASIPGIESITKLTPYSFHLNTLTNTDPRISIFNAAAQAQNPIIELKPATHNLQEYFHQITQQK